MSQTPDVLADPAGTWVELLGPVTGLDVVLLDHSAGPAAALLDSAGARVLSGAPAGFTDNSADAVVLADVVVNPAQCRQAARVLRPGGVLLAVSRNATGSLALRGGGPRASLRGLGRSAEAAGLTVRARYGVLRSVQSPSTLFELDHPRVASLVLAGSNVLNDGARRRAVETLRWAARRGLAGPVMPAVAVLCSDRPLSYDPPLGRIGVLGSAEVKLLFGDPTSTVEKVYCDPDRAHGEAAALQAVHRVWPGLAPQVLAQCSPLRTRLTWLTGATLDLDRLGTDEAERWVLRAAGVLGELDRRLAPATVHHGDFWLGNLLVDLAAGTVTGIIDWTEAGRDDAPADLAFLVDSWVSRAALDPAAAVQLRERTEAAYALARHRLSG